MATNPCRRRYTGCAVYAIRFSNIRTACRYLFMNDNLALSFIMLIKERTRHFEALNARKRRRSARQPVSRHSGRL